MEGAKYVCSPPPRDKPSQDACWAGIEQGCLTFIRRITARFATMMKRANWCRKAAPVSAGSQMGFRRGDPVADPVFRRRDEEADRSVAFRAHHRDHHAKAYGLYPARAASRSAPTRTSPFGIRRSRAPSTTPICTTVPITRPMKVSRSPVGRSQRLSAGGWSCKTAF